MTATRFGLAAVPLMLLAACAIPRIEPEGLEGIDDGLLPEPNARLAIESLGPCSDVPDRQFSINTGEPVTVLVHGCYGSAGRLRSLSQVYAFHGQQSVCFSYDDRDSLEVSSRQLMTALEALGEAMDDDVAVNVLAHSQGGLVARRAVIEDRPDGLTLSRVPNDLVTVATPFAGIPAASACGSRLTHVLSLGITVGICRYISGDKWWEITAASDFIQQPGAPLPELERHLKVVTDERDTCRVKDDRGRCISRDGVFGVAEQYHPPVDRFPVVSNVQVEAGHVEIVGDARRPPVKLIEILQVEGLLAPTPPDRQAAFEALLARLYGP
ncbi:esterase/lipase family protein [Natronospira bacteriovora]|uniref:DUF676 domain-containing protein n=1 Tax=Natronospira bacteriovora TaxID=3069753 RepID=A0ABU0W7F5_9GAMM|nr:hypothetical protein [Natronospira sp. AB-CW4]MDQ2068940.1 hypothetical protein [Natronospira sp. AB-CW4]